MGKINYLKLLTKEDCEKITAEQYETINKEATFHSNYLRRQFYPDTLKEFLHTRSREIAFLGIKYRDEDDTYKELLATNITFNDDSKLISYLLSSGYNFEDLSSLVDLISKTKQACIVLRRLGLKPNEDLKISNNQLGKICNWFRRYFGYDDYNLVLAKIVDLVVFKKELYLELQGKHLI